MTEWKTIDSAPKDGTAILAWGAQHGERVVVEIDMDGPREDPVKWVEVWGLVPVSGLTHWMPLPDPPE
jgi:hypothetical protein